MNKMLLNIPMRFETDRLFLRPYQAGDGPRYHEMARRNRRHLERYERGNPALSLETEEQAEVLMREYAAYWVARDRFFLGAFSKSTAEFVAQIYVGPASWDVPEFKVGYFADADHEGQGYVTEAVIATIEVLIKHLGAHRLSLECDDTNLRSARVAERCGFVKEGHFRENKRHPDGAISGTFHYGLLRNDWLMSRTGE